MTQPAASPPISTSAPSEKEEPALSLEEEILIAADLLSYEPLDGADPNVSLTPEQRKEALADANEAFLEIRGRVRKIDWQGLSPYEVTKDLPTDKNYRIRAIFGSMRDDLPVAYSLGDMRVYVEPKQSLPGDSFRCITLNRISPAVTHEPLTRSTYALEIGRELERLIELDEMSDQDEAGDEECPKCHAEVDEEDAFCASCGASLSDPIVEG